MENPKVERITRCVKELATKKLTCVNFEDVDAFVAACNALCVVANGGAFVFGKSGVSAQYFYTEK